MTQPPVVPGHLAPPAPHYPPPRKGLSAAAIVGIALAVALVLGVVVFVGLTVVTAAATSGSKDKSSPVELKLTACTSDGDFYRATVAVRNNSSRAQSVYAMVEWLDASGTRVADARVYVSDLAAGQSSVEEAISYGATRSGTRCTVRLR